MEPLEPYVVLYVDDVFNVPEGALFRAENMEHAEEMFESENPKGNVIWVVQTDSIDHAFTDYHMSVIE